jgi:hypothetical protein
VTWVISGETGNLVVKVDVKENTELLEPWVSSSKANLVSGKAN